MSAVAVKVDENDKVDITLEKLNELLKDAYNDGYKAGRDSVPYISPLTTPIYPQSPTTPINPSKIYWTSGSDIALLKTTKVNDEPNRTCVNTLDDLTVTGTITKVKEEL